MVCPYCSADMTPIELNGKVFCSNCGLTIANNAPQESYIQPIINPEPDVVSNVKTNAPEEIEFPVVPEVVESIEPTVADIPAIPVETVTPPIDYFGQFSEPEVESSPENEGVKLTVTTEDVAPTPEPIVEMARPITEQTERDLGLEINLEPATQESKISDLVIPSEDDFDITEPAVEAVSPVSSYVELANPGDERETLEASGILLDILGEESTSVPATPSLVIPSKAEESISNISEGSLQQGRDDTKLDPILEPELPAETATKVEDDIYTLPSEIKVGLRKKKTAKPVVAAVPVAAEDILTDTIDTKTEKKIEALEEKITEIPEPVISVTPDEATRIDPDTITPDEIKVNDSDKSKVIKDYFSTAIEKDKTKIKAKKKQIKKKKSHKAIGIVALSLTLVVILGSGGYYGYNYLSKPAAQASVSEKANFTILTPEYIPEGYALSSTSYDSGKDTQVSTFQFADDKGKTITLKQVRTDKPSQVIADYIQGANTSYTQKEVGGVVYTETKQPSLLWQNGEFVLILETQNFTYSNDFIYKMAEAVK